MLRVNLLALLAIPCLITLGGSRADAALVISYGSELNLVQGQAGTLDVFIRSTDGNDDLSLFSAKFMISPVVGSGLEFLDPPNDTQYTDPNYIFAGTDIDGLSSVVGPADTIFVSDGTLGPAGFVTVPTDNRLLARLDITAQSAAANSQFRVFLMNDDGTDFLDDGFTSIGVAGESFNNFGVVNVSAVPEPSSVLGLATAGTAIIAIRRRRLKRT